MNYGSHENYDINKHISSCLTPRNTYGKAPLQLTPTRFGRKRVAALLYGYNIRYRSRCNLLTKRKCSFHKKYKKNGRNSFEFSYILILK